MSGLTVFYALLFYVAAAVMVIGLIVKIRTYARTPAPLKIPVTPAPLTKAGVAVRLGQEVLFFRSLFRSNKWIWIFAVLFHAALVLVLARHVRYFNEPVWTWVALVQPFGQYAGFAMVAGLGGLWARRVLVERVRYISSPSDHLMLALLALIGVTGLGMDYVARTDIIQVKAFALGLLRLSPQELPADPVLLIHLGAVAILMLVFPFSKLLHVPGVFFAPSRNQVDNAREKRHLADWAAPLDAQRDA